MPEKIEVFVDDQKLLVDPGTTVLQVRYWQLYYSTVIYRYLLQITDCIFECLEVFPSRFS